MSSFKPRSRPPHVRPEETSVLLRKELSRRGMNDAEIDATIRKKKRRNNLVFNAVNSKHLVDMRPLINKRGKIKARPARESGTRETGQLCTVHFAAEQLKLHRKTILRFIREGRLVATRVGKSYRIKRSDLESFSGLPASANTTANSPSITSIVDIPDVSPHVARKWQTNISVALNTSQRKQNVVRADVIYSPEQSHLRLVVVGQSNDCVPILNLIHAWIQQLKSSV